MAEGMDAISKMSVTELSKWMAENGVNDSYCELFEGNTGIIVLTNLASY